MIWSADWPFWTPGSWPLWPGYEPFDPYFGPFEPNDLRPGPKWPKESKGPLTLAVTSRWCHLWHHRLQPLAVDQRDTIHAKLWPDRVAYSDIRRRRALHRWTPLDERNKTSWAKLASEQLHFFSIFWSVSYKPSSRLWLYWTVFTRPTRETNRLINSSISLKLLRSKINHGS